MRKIATLLSVLVLILLISCNSTETVSSKPNVIIIMTDDQGNNLGCLGNPWLKTPHIDELYNESVRLTNFHQDMLCTPSRASLMTGRYPIRTGAWRTSRGRTNLRAEEVTIAEVFRENGYRTGQFGKWHLGDTWPFRPQDQGFEEVVGHLCGGISQISDHWGNDYFDDTYHHNGIPTQYEGYCTDVFFGEAIRFIRENKDQPFLVYISPNIAHLPNIVGEEYSRPYEEMGLDKGQTIYYGMITNLDENMGRLLDFLKEEGLHENTILAFTTDDGPQKVGQQFDEGGWALEHGFNAGQRGGKGSGYEGGHRLFSFVRWPAGGVGGGKEISPLTSVMDVLPTMMDLCEITPMADLDLDGISFKPALYGKELQGNSERTLVISKFRIEKMDSLEGNLCVMYQDWRLVNNRELYNVKNDPAQTKDMASSYPEIVERIRGNYADWLEHATKTINEPVRFVLGDDRARKISLTTQDSYVLKGNSVFAQRHVLILSSSNASWKVTFAQDGKYRFKLSRYPLYTGYAFNKNVSNDEIDFDASMAKLSVGGQVVQKNISPSDNYVDFELAVEAGDSDLQTWLISSDGNDIPSYYVDVEILE